MTSETEGPIFSLFNPSVAERVRPLIPPCGVLQRGAQSPRGSRMEGRGGARLRSQDLSGARSQVRLLSSGRPWVSSLPHTISDIPGFNWEAG